MEDKVVEAVAKIVGDVSTDQVQRVLGALRMVREGAPVGTVVQDPKTGSVAVRVSEDGLPLWRVTATDGGEWKDLQPRLDGWTVLSEPTV